MQPKPAPARLSSACRFMECLSFLSFSDIFFRFYQKKPCDYSFNRGKKPKRRIFLFHTIVKECPSGEFTGHLNQLFKMTLIPNYMT
jgi:hypothetical protein